MKQKNFDDLFERIEKFIDTSSDEDFKLSLKKANFEYYNKLEMNVFSEDFLFGKNIYIRINSKSHSTVGTINFSNINVRSQSNYRANDFDYRLAA